MRIDSYRFGRIVIDGKRYENDVIIFPDRVQSNWWREEGHRLQIEDISEILNEKPDILVIGTGAYGFMKIPDNVKNFIKEKGIELVIERTEDACEIYNKLSGKGRVIAALHLTC